jgi:hypothetical protein
MTVLIILTVAGSSTTLFDLYSDSDGFTNPFETGITRASLLAGYTTNLCPDDATVVRVQATESCVNYIDILLVNTTTTTTTTVAPTTTTTTTTTVAPTTTTTTTSGSGSFSVLKYSTETYSGTIPNSWQNPNNINQIEGEASDYVLKNQSGSRPTSTLVARRFNFNIPLNATIDGIVVRVRKRVDTAGKAVDRYIQFYNSTFIGTNKASTTLYDSNYVTTEYGGPNDLWGLTLTPNMLNSDIFSLVMQATWVDDGIYNVYIQWMTVEVYYTIT